MFLDSASHVLSLLAEPQLPEYCTPTTPFLENVSAYTHVCIPTPLAFTSTLLGTLSILSWLFAQLPQIVRNYKNQSTAGLSLFFLVEWNLGDLSNVFGAILTHQAAWQIIIGGYYCFVDICLVAQWIWYERLKHGLPLRRIRLVRSKSQQGPPGQLPDLVEPIDASDRQSLSSNEGTIRQPRDEGADPQDIPTSKSSHAKDMFSTPVYGTISPSASLSTSPASRTIHRIQQQSLPNASPRTVLFITLMIALATARASPVAKLSYHTADSEDEPAFAFDLGTILSWTSTALYLLSRLPQIIMNYRRKSTAGLSPTLFAAAFCGNLFYSSSLALNPCAWQSFEAHGGHGWVDRHGSEQAEWVAAALPFFLGAFGVLGLDGAVGVQFWLYGEGTQGIDSVLVVQEGGGRGKDMSMRIRKVSGWMRGWQPSTDGKIAPVIRVRTATEPSERQPLLDSRRVDAPSSRQGAA